MQNALVPSALAQLLEAVRDTGAQLPTLSAVTVAGARLSEAVVAMFASLLPCAELLYGFDSSETEPVNLRTVLPRMSDEHPTHVGHPLPNVALFVLKPADIAFAPQGEIGELCVSATHLALGYLDEPDLTAQRFVTLPLPDNATPVFRTGDLVRLLSDGQIELLGRINNQVKIRGLLVSPQEVEAALLRYSELQHVAVIAREVGGENKLAGYLVSRGSTNPPIGDLLLHLADFIPEYMIPASFVFLDSLPLTSTGKLDRNRLPQIASTRPRLDTPFSTVRNSIERRLEISGRSVIHRLHWDL